MKLYHLTYLVSPELSEEKLKAFSQKVETLIQENQGNLQKIEKPIKTNLGAPIEKNGSTFGSAFVSSLTFYIDKSKVKQLQQKLLGLQDILRFMLVCKKIAKMGRGRTMAPSITKKWVPKTEKKVELKEIEKKLGEILGE